MKKIPLIARCTPLCCMGGCRCSDCRYCGAKTEAQLPVVFETEEVAYDKWVRSNAAYLPAEIVKEVIGE